MSNDYLSPSEREAVRRFQKYGLARLGPHARRTLARLQRRLREETEMRSAIDWDLRDAELRKRAGASPHAGPSAGVQSPAPAPRSPAGGAASAASAGGAFPSVARRTAIDANQLTDREYVALLQAHGLDSTFFVARNAPPPPRPSTALALAQNSAQRRAEAANKKREAEIEAGRVDGRSATPEEVQARVEQLLGPHRERPVLDGAFAPIGKPLPAPDRGPDPLAASLEAKRKAERRARQALKEKRPVDVRRMPADVFAEYLRLKKFAGGW